MKVQSIRHKPFLLARVLPTTPLVFVTGRRAIGGDSAGIETLGSYLRRLEQDSSGSELRTVDD